MHVLVLTLALVSRVVPGQAVHDRTSFQPMAIVMAAPVAMLQTQQQPPPPAQPPAINVEVNRGGRGWYANPVWVAIGGLALVIVILMIVMAARGSGPGGTTVVRG
jgi:hypothetical protein